MLLTTAALTVTPPSPASIYQTLFYFCVLFNFWGCFDLHVPGEIDYLILLFFFVFFCLLRPSFLTLFSVSTRFSHVPRFARAARNADFGLSRDRFFPSCAACFP